MRTKIVKPFTTELKAVAFENLRMVFEAIYPGENIYLFGNLHFKSFDIDALLLTKKNVIFYEFKLNTIEQNRVTVSDRHPWLYNDSTTVFPGRHESNPTFQMRRKRNLLYRRLQHIQYIYGCVLFVRPCRPVNNRRSIDFFKVCDMKSVISATRSLEKHSTNEVWSHDSILSYLNSHNEAGYYLPDPNYLPHLRHRLAAAQQPTVQEVAPAQPAAVPTAPARRYYTFPIPESTYKKVWKKQRPTLLEWFKNLFGSMRRVAL